MLRSNSKQSAMPKHLLSAEKQSEQAKMLAI